MTTLSEEVARLIETHTDVELRLRAAAFLDKCKEAPMCHVGPDEDGFTWFGDDDVALLAAAYVRLLTTRAPDAMPRVYRKVMTDATGVKDSLT